MRKGASMRIAVCDRKTEDREELKKQISEYWRDVSVDVADSGEEIFRRIQEGSRYDMVFLNVEDNDRENLETGEALHRQFPDIALILDSTSRVFGVEAFEMDALYYLVKPYTPEVFRKIRSRFRKPDGTMGKVPMDGKISMDENVSVDKRLPVDRTIPIGKEKLREISHRQIVYLESCHNYLLIHLTSGAMLKIRGSMQEVMDTAGSYFLRVNRHYIVNMEAITGIRGNSCEAAGRVFTFSRKNRTANKKKYSDWLFRKAIGEAALD